MPGDDMNTPWCWCAESGKLRLGHANHKPVTIAGSGFQTLPTALPLPRN
jgi:hypothetical protein